MRKLAVRLNRLIVMEEIKLPTWMRTKVLKVCNYLLYPEFRRRNYGHAFRRTIVRTFIGTFIYMFAMLALSLISDQHKLAEKDQAILSEKRKVVFLNDSAMQYMYNQVVDSVENSADYKRYQIFVKTGELIPKNTMTAEHLKTVLETSETKNIPLSIYVRVIKHESGFDSGAVNPASGAFGYMQLLPSTWRGLSSAMKLTNETAVNNLLAGGYFLSREFQYWSHRGRNKREAWEMALASYAVGDSLTVALDRVPESAQDYVNFVMKTYSNN
jgi:hypothetical protein